MYGLRLDTFCEQALDLIAEKQNHLPGALREVSALLARAEVELLLTSRTAEQTRSTHFPDSRMKNCGSSDRSEHENSPQRVTITNANVNPNLTFEGVERFRLGACEVSGCPSALASRARALTPRSTTGRRICCDAMKYRFSFQRPIAAILTLFWGIRETVLFSSPFTS